MSEELDQIEQKLKTEKIEPLEKRVEGLEQKFEFQKFSKYVVGIIEEGCVVVM